jgi:hypothetical protein
MDKPVDLDKHRAAADQAATESRRQRREESQSDEDAHIRRQAELEKLLRADPAETWPQAAARAKFLIIQFAETPEARDPRYAELIANVLDDLSRLCRKDQEGA